MALLGSLLAILVLGAGAAASVRWSTLLLVHERDQHGRFEIMRLLEDLLETGATATGGRAGGSAVWHHTLPDGSPIRLEFTDQPRQATGDPAVGHHRQITARWTDPLGVARQLSLRTYWYPAPRIY